MVRPDWCHDGHARHGDSMNSKPVHEILAELRHWQPYYPVGYPIQDGIHNPWVVIDPISGATAYQVWQALDCTPDATKFRRRLAELGHGVSDEW